MDLGATVCVSVADADGRTEVLHYFGGVAQLRVASFTRVASAALSLRRVSRLSRLRSAFSLRIDSFVLRTMFIVATRLLAISIKKRPERRREIAKSPLAPAGGSDD